MRGHAHALWPTSPQTSTLPNHSLGTQYLTVAYLIYELAEEEIILIGAASPFAEAWDIMSQMMSAVADQLPEMDKIATLEARALRRRFAELGYFV